MTVDERVHADTGEAPSRRPRRTDAVRNYDALVAAAREEFQENGTDASLKAVARRAGVGIATLYRNFPTRTSLLEAVYADDVNDTVNALCGSAAAAGRANGADGEDAWRRLEDWLDRFVRTVAEDAALREVFSPEALCLSPCRRTLSEAVEGLITRTGAALPTRCGMAVDEFLRTVVSLGVSPLLTRTQREHALAVLLDGLRYGAKPADGPDGPPTPENEKTERT
ncbi:TetR family transcriptional regulator [Streptomyces hygroscopicus subsp. hygroscopicus]|uniref:TetR/AcrR family transcriptional regulator n=1 Tax=Streptomyces sp. KHY 26 TaxID=3097359 RepID=UPI0024A341E9|nr:TetR/AcrR family transcriptional regulator [Streptomyces hygroscopicus]GLX49149.1 TetR family transcriptional regulator [Streptomyces hygroscopicus subsp. hygroscopicus]